MRWLLLAALLSGCAPLAAQHQADAAFRKALAAQLGGQNEYATQQYRVIVDLGFDWSPVWNNLGVLAARRHQYSAARKLFGAAVAADARDIVALTNYGVLSYYLYDYAESRRALADVDRLRRDNLDHIPTMGRSDYFADHYAKVTEPLVAVASKYLDRIERASMGAEVPSTKDLLAALQLHTFE